MKASKLKSNRSLYRMVIILLFIGCSGCSTVSYYSQSIAGQTEIWMKQQPIDKLLSDPKIKPALKQRLEFVKAIRQYSIDELGLPENNSYLSYADLNRQFVVWTIYATPPYSLEPKTWCYLVVGCLGYKGFFSEKAARDELTKLQKQGLDVYMGGVVAYSTLGWFDDPVLSTMLNWSDLELAKVILHELAHQLLYLKDDTVFNESFAETIAIIGVRKWLEDYNNKELAFEFEQLRKVQQLFIKLVFKYKDKLQHLYQSDLSAIAMERKKSEIFKALQTEYEAKKKNWLTVTYNNWFSNNLNNAKLVSVVTYHEYVEDMLVIYKKSGRQMKHFFDIMKRLSQCNKNRRIQLIKQQIANISC